MDDALKVLIVDDDLTTLHGYSRVLENGGYEVIKAATGREGLDLAVREKPHLILLDVMLPDLDGLDICRRIKADPALEDCFIVLLSGLKISSDHQAEGLDTGADGYIARPVSNRELLARVQAMFRIRNALAQIKDRERQQAVVAELGRYALTEADVSSLRNECAARVCETLGAECCAIFEPAGDGTDMLILKAATGWKGGSVGEMRLSLDSLPGYALVTRQPVVVENMKEETRFKPDSSMSDDWVSGLGVVMSGRCGSAGVLTACSRFRRTFTHNDVHFLQSVANVLTAAMERKRTEEELVTARKLEATGILAGGIAHDFNNLLGIVSGNIELAQMMGGLSPSANSALQVSQSAVMRAAELTRRLIALAEGGSPFKTSVSVRKLLVDSVASALHGSDVLCEFSFPDDASWSGAIEVDPGQIRQAIYNIVANSLEAMPEGGSLEVCAGIIDVDSKAGAVPPFLKGEDFVRISIKDQGTGIPEEILSRIFDPYFSTKRRCSEKGMGLGLAVVHSIIRRHGGHVRVESKVGAGTVFDIYLPALRERKNPHVVQPSGKASISEARRVLVMDDEEQFAHLMRKMLEFLGCAHVELAGDGGEALRCFERAGEDGSPFDVVILDLTVKSGMGGKETMARLLEIDPAVRAIVSSGYSNDPVMSDFREYGFCGALAKPFKIRDLAEALRAAADPDLPVH